MLEAGTVILAKSASFPKYVQHLNSNPSLSVDLVGRGILAPNSTVNSSFNCSLYTYVTVYLLICHVAFNSMFLAGIVVNSYFSSPNTQPVNV